MEEDADNSFVIELSASDGDCSLASSASGYDNSALTAADPGYQELASDQPGYRLLSSSRLAHTLVAPGEDAADSDDETRNLFASAPRDRTDRAGESVIAVGSGSLVSAAHLELRSSAQDTWHRLFHAAAASVKGESAYAHLERVLALPAEGAEQQCRKWSLALELVEAALRRIGGAPHEFVQGASNVSNDPILKWSNVLLSIKVRLRQQLQVALAPVGAVDAQVAERLQRGATPDALVAARCILKHQVRHLATQRVDWNEQFQMLLDLPEDSTEAKVYKYSALSHTAKDFTYAAELCARVIVNELAVPVPLKTIKPVTGMQGTAGGIKFQSSGILFKLASDHHNLYGSIAAAQKASGHELKSMAAYFDCRIPGMHVPLSCLIDYRGHRIMAMSILPIDRSTLAYGSDDGGRTVHDDEPNISKKMREAAALLNLAPHLAGVMQQRYLASACDVEGHRGRDGRIYCIDFARGFPPETPRIIHPHDAASAALSERYRGAHLYRLLRPELVKKAPSGPLSPDAFSAFGGQSPKHNRDVRDATNYLIREVIPQFARDMDSSPLLAHPGELLHRMSQLLHRAGINVRYMGAVRHASANATLRSVLMIEMMARAVKRLIWDGFRKVEATQALPTEEPYRKFAVEQFNMLLAPEAPDFWYRLKSEICAYFGAVAMEAWEQRDDYDLRRHCDGGVAVLVRRVASLTGIRVAEEALSELDQRLGSSGFVLVDADVERIDTRIKSMNVVEISSAITLSMQAALSTEQDRLFKLCYRKFEAAANASPSNITTSRYWTLALLAHAQGLSQSNPARACALLSEADLRMRDCATLSHKPSLVAHCNIVKLLAQLTADVPHAAGLFCRALALASAAEEPAMMAAVVDACRAFAAELSSAAAATLVLNRLRVALTAYAERSTAMKNACNAVSVDLLELAGPLDVDMVESMYSAFVSDLDDAALVKLVATSFSKYAALPDKPGLDAPLRLLAMADSVVARNPANAVALEVRGKLGLLMACNNVTELRPVEAAILAGVQCMQRTGPSASARAYASASADRLMTLFFATTVFLENSYHVRTHCPLAHFAPRDLAASLAWDPVASEWTSTQVGAERLAAKLRPVCRVVVACMELNADAPAWPHADTLSLPMIASLFALAEPSPKLRALVGQSLTSLNFSALFGLDDSSSLAVVQCCAPNVTAVACTPGPVAAALLLAATPQLRNLQRLDVSKAAVAALDLEQLLHNNCASLKWLSLPGGCKLARNGAVLRVLTEVVLSPKLQSDTVYGLLSRCVALVTLIQVRGEKRSVWRRAAPGGGNDDATSLAASWGRALAAAGAVESSMGRDLCKAFYRGYLAHDHLGLVTLASREDQLVLLHKLGQPLLARAVAQFVSAKQFDTLYALLCTVDRLESYDPTSMLGWLVDQLRTALLGNSYGHVQRYFGFARDHRLPFVLASLPVAVMERMMAHFLQQPDCATFVAALFETLRQTLEHGRANANVIACAAQILSARIATDRNAIGAELARTLLALHEHAPPQPPVQCFLLMLTLRCDAQLVEQLQPGLGSLSSLCIVNVPTLLDGPMLRKVASLLPQGPLLRHVAVRYSAGVREELAVDDEWLCALARRCPNLLSLHLDLCPQVSNVGLTAIARACTELEELCIRAPAVTDEALAVVVEQLGARLRVLTLQCGVRDLMMSRMGSQLTALQRIEIFSCPFVTLHGLEKLVANASPLLRAVAVQDCRQIKLDLVQMRLLKKKLADVSEKCSTIERAGATK